MAKQRCSKTDPNTLPPIPCEGQDGHDGKCWRTIPKDAPNHPQAGQKRFFVADESTAKVEEAIAKQKQTEAAAG